MHVHESRPLQEYADLKSELFDLTRKSGAAISTYLFVSADGYTALCGLIGMAFSNLYLALLFRDVDNVKPTDKVPMMQAKNVRKTMPTM